MATVLASTGRVTVDLHKKCMYRMHDALGSVAAHKVMVKGMQVSDQGLLP